MTTFFRRNSSRARAASTGEQSRIKTMYTLAPIGKKAAGNDDPSTRIGGADVKRGGLLAVVLFAMVFVTASAVMAHHGTAGYDETNMSTFPKVTITEVEWANPPCPIHFNRTTD